MIRVSQIQSKFWRMSFDELKELAMECLEKMADEYALKEEELDSSLSECDDLKNALEALKDEIASIKKE